MPRTRSAAKQARASLRRQSHNKSVKSELHTLERKLLSLIETKKPAEAAAAFRDLTSALDKAAKTQIIHRNLADRKKSRLTARIRAVSPQKTEPPAKTSLPEKAV